MPARRREVESLFVAPLTDNEAREPPFLPRARRIPYLGPKGPTCKATVRSFEGCAFWADDLVRSMQGDGATPRPSRPREPFSRGDPNWWPVSMSDPCRSFSCCNEPALTSPGYVQRMKGHCLVLPGAA